MKKIIFILVMAFSLNGFSQNLKIPVNKKIPFVHVLKDTVVGHEEMFIYLNDSTRMSAYLEAEIDGKKLFNFSLVPINSKREWRILSFSLGSELLAENESIIVYFQQRINALRCVQSWNNF